MHSEHVNQLFNHEAKEMLCKTQMDRHNDLSVCSWWTIVDWLRHVSDLLRLPWSISHPLRLHMSMNQAEKRSIWQSNIWRSS